MNIIHGCGRLARVFGMLLLAALLPVSGFGQMGILFEDDFDSGAIDPGLWRISDVPFETGTTDILPTADFGELNFYGFATSNYWGGSSVATVPTFSIVPGEALVVKVERIYHQGVSTASRSALWVTDATRSSYFLFADNFGEDGWTYNFLTGKPATDRPTNVGVNLPYFDDPFFNDGQFHEVTLKVNGQTVKMLVDGELGGEAAYPFSDNIVFEVGAYARADTDEVDVTFDNFSVERIGVVQFSKAALAQTLTSAEREVQISVPAGMLTSQSISVDVISDNPDVAAPVGADAGGLLTVNFAQGGPNTKTILVNASGLGTAVFSLEPSEDIEVWNTLTVTVPEPATVFWADDFEDGVIDPALWRVEDLGFEPGTADMTAVESDGELSIGGVALTNWWGGQSLATIPTFSANPYTPLVFEIDRVSLTAAATAARSGIYISNADRSQYVFFAQNLGENGWQMNVNPGSPTGGGTDLTAFDIYDGDGGPHTMKIMADGTTARLYLDDVLGGTASFPVSEGIHFEFGTYLRAGEASDTGTSVFDNVTIQTVLPCIEMDVALIEREATDLGIDTVLLTVPEVFALGDDATVVITSDNPAVAAPVGGTDGVLTLTFTPDGDLTVPFDIETLGIGTATLTVSNAQGVCAPAGIAVAVSYIPEVLFSDDFEDGAMDPLLWRIDPVAFETGTGEFSAVEADGVMTLSGALTTNWWAGYALATQPTFDASLTGPLTFEIDRVSHVGAGTAHRSALWITDESRTNYILFAENQGETGWSYNYRVNGGGPATGSGTSIGAFAGAPFPGGGNHRMKAVANGQTVKLFLDNVFGAEIPFPFTTGIVFEIGVYGRNADLPDTVTAVFDNAQILGVPAGGEPEPVEVSIDREAGSVVLTWMAIPDAAYQVQVSSNLSDWVDADGGALIAEGDSASWTDESATQAVKYYRVISLP